MSLVDIIRTGRLANPRAVVGMDDEIPLATKGTSNESRALFDVPQVDLFENNNKQAWLDLKSGWCHLCKEPIGGSMGIHIGDRDHTCLQLFLHLYARYPRVWNSENLLKHAKAKLPPIHSYATNSREMDHLHVMDDAQRRTDLEALLVHMTSGPHCALTHNLQGNTPLQFWYSGERMFKPHISQMVSQMFPAMSAGVMTTFTHKCWGRSNLERLYDALNVADIVRSFGGTPKETRESKAFYMRAIFWELTSADFRPEAEVDEVTHYLIQITKRRLSFEMIFLQSMQYMNRVQDVCAEMGHPTPEELMELGLL